MPNGVTPTQAVAAPATGETPRMRALRQLSTQMPAASQRVARQFQAGQAMQLQQAAQAAPAATPAAAQQLGTAMAGQAGAQAVQQAQQSAQQGQQLGQLGLEAQRQQSQATLTGLEEGAREEAMSSRERLARISDQAAREMFDARVNFARDEMGRTFLNRRQLADYARTQAESAEAFKDYAQKAEQVQKTTMRIQEAAHNALAQALENEHKLREQGLSNTQIRELAQAKAALNKKIEQDKADAAARSGMWSTLGGLVGGVVGFVYGGGPVGAGAGYAIGSGLGRAASGMGG